MIKDGDGIDGVTNTFAAAIWFVDFAISAMELNLWDIIYDSSG